MSYDAELAFAKELAQEAGTIMKRYFRAEDIGTEWKSDNTPVTVADKTVNDMVIKRVKEKFPGYGVIGEEASFEADGDFVWVVDPIDGTIPFSLGIPISTFLLALVDRSNGQPVVAVIYDPYLDQLYTATKGGGAFLNDKPISTSQTIAIARSYLILAGPPTQTETINYQPGVLTDKLRSQTTYIFRVASGAYVAAKIATEDFSVMIYGGEAQAWDFAAPCLIVREAGGRVTDLAGQDRRFDEVGFGCVLAANEAVLNEAIELAKG